MATIRRFEDLEVWQLAKGQCGEFYKLAAEGAFKGNYPLQDQMDRSSASVMDNIAEGFDRHTKADFRHFLVMARGSNAEFRSQLYRATGRNLISPTQFETLRTQSEQLGVKLHHFIGYLSRTPIKEKPTPSIPNQVQDDGAGYDSKPESSFPQNLPYDFFLSLPQNIA